MEFVQRLLLKIPIVPMGFIVVGCAVAFGITGLLLVRRFAHPSKLKQHNDVADPLIGVLGTIYAVLIAFVVIIVWQQFDKCSDNVKMEANRLGHLYRDGEAFSPEFRQKLNPLLREYRDKVVRLEWPAMDKGEMSPEVEQVMNKIWDVYTSYRPRNKTEEIFFSESVAKLNEFRGLRRERIMDSRRGIEPILWFVLVFGGMTLISFTFLFGAELKAHIVMVLLLSALIGLMLFTIMELDYPFTGTITISTEPFQRAVLD